ncbi:MAG: ABC transporter substrate-binding protein [Alphaproteobacteria bacterium]
MSSLIRSMFAFSLSVALLYGVLPSAYAQGGTITVYTSYEEDEAAAFLEAAKKALPDIEVSLLRLSTGDLAARIIAESSNPRHDVLWGFAASTIVNPDILSGLEAYTPVGIDKVAPQFRDPGGKWFATTGYMAAFCVNEERLAERGLPRPSSWADLLDPVYQGEIVMPNPASSGTGFIQIDSILQMKGEEAGWAYLEALDKNIAQYIKSGSKPCHAASAGEYAIGASYGLRAIKNIDEGFPISMVIPSEGSGNELEANALVASSDNKAAAKRFLDWTLTEQAATEYYAWKGIVTIPGGKIPQKFLDAGLPEDVSTILYPVDFQMAGSDRTRIIETWQSRFER